MGFEIYDYRADIRNILITPQIRSRFLRMEVGQVNRFHSHDLGHEIFLILQGQAEFEMKGEARVLGPGQLCIALCDEGHIVRNVGAEPVIMYLSVTPHIQPTHTLWTEAGSKEPPHFNPSTAYDVPLDRTTPTAELVDCHLKEAETLAEVVAATTQVQQAQAAAFKQAVAAGDKTAAFKARDTMWEALYNMYKQVYELAEAWNALTSRTADSEF